jgi:hypothetical protein
MEFIFGLLVGVFLGAFLGIIVMALAVAAGQADRASGAYDLED